jgi:hypothetical protein
VIAHRIKVALRQASPQQSVQLNKFLPECTAVIHLTSYLVSTVFFRVYVNASVIYVLHFLSVYGSS